jgi:hypothetical protein
MAVKKGFGLGNLIKKMFGIADDAPTVDPDKIKKIDDFTKGYDDTTPPGQFKNQGEVIDDQGNVVAKEYSYTPESFTETQKRTGVGSYSDEALREQYIDSVDADVMSFDEFVIKQRGISLDQLEAERAMRAKKVSPEPKQVATPEADKFISDVKAATNRSEEDIRETIVDIMNEGYEMGDPKRTMFDDDEMINAFLGVKKINQRDNEEFVDEFLKRLAQREPSEYAPPVLRDKDSFKLKAGERVFKDDDFQKSYDMVDEFGFRVTDDPSDIIPYSQLSERDIRLIKLGVPMNSKKYKAQMKGLKEGKLLSDLEDDPIKKANAKAFEDASGATDRAKINKADDELKQKATDEIMEAIQEGDFKKAEEIENAFNDGTYVPGGKKRTLNAKGGRIGFADGDFVAPEDIITKPADNENRIAEYMAKIETGELVYDPETKQFIPAPKKRRRQNTRPADNEEYMSDLMYRMKMNEMYGKKDGGRIGFAEGGGGPKINRRNFLQLAGAGLASLMFPFGRAAKEAAPVVTKAIQPVAGMPDWFPLLVNRIRTKGKVAREPGYKEFTSGGDTEKIYKLDDYTLYEDMATGKVTVSGRGNDYQQVSMEYTPGENKVMTKKNPITGKMERGVMTEKPRFEAGEYAKGDPYDYENFGDFDDLKGDVRNWEDFATGGRKTDEKTVKQAVEEFINKQTDPNIIDDMAKGGRVGMAQGGIASKFKERVHYGN